MRLHNTTKLLRKYGKRPGKEINQLLKLSVKIEIKKQLEINRCLIGTKLEFFGEKLDVSFIHATIDS